jgi:hypothetical protein
VRRPYVRRVAAEAGGKGCRGERDAQELWLTVSPTRGGFLTMEATATAVGCGGWQQTVVWR